MKHAKEHNGKVVCRETGKEIANFCRSKKEKNNEKF
jgi:hypothetical protein